MAVLTGQYHSMALHRQVSFAAVLPIDNVDEMGKRSYGSGPFPTLYLLHGYTGNYMDWLYHGSVASLASQYHTAIVLADGGNSFYLNNPNSTDDYADLIGSELVNVTRRLFPLSEKREETWIGGLSMGGFGALRNGLFYNKVFGAVVALSAALITDEVAAMKPGSDNGVAPYAYYVHTFGEPSKVMSSDVSPKYMVRKRLSQGERLPRLFLACGTEDFLFAANQDMHSYLDQMHVAHEWLTHPGVHDFAFWNYALPIAMEWLWNKIQ